MGRGLFIRIIILRAILECLAPERIEQLGILLLLHVIAVLFGTRDTGNRLSLEQAQGYGETT